MNCGTCGTECGAGEICTGGTCSSSCYEGLAMCSGVCVDLMRDPANCGSCGRACSSGEFCYDGDCTAACPGGFTDCSGTCRDLSSDRENCGACGAACSTGELCVGSTCEVTCESPLVDCSGECSDTRSDPENCGACGTPCGVSEACVLGSCEPFVGNVGTVRKVDGTWIPVNYQLCGTGSPGSCTATTAKASCTAIGYKIVSHASNGTTEVLSLGATSSCYWSVSYYTISMTMPTTSCLVAISNLDWTTCCGTTTWHGNTLGFGAGGATFGYVYSSDSGYVSTYTNLSGATWGCQSLTTAATNRSGCTLQYVACTPP